jgi:thiol-disulfide isomerase/thioredoxin
VRVAPCVIIAAVLLGLCGCKLFSKKSPPPGPAASDPLLPRADRAGPPGDVRTAAAADADNHVIPTSAGNGLLAGQVIDSYSRPAEEAYILVSFPKQNGQPEKKPIDVAANAQGYFTISGLQPGGNYQLTARARDGKRMLAGTTWVKAPNPRVLIRISEDFVSKNTPPIPPPPAWPGSNIGKEEKPAAAENPQPKSPDGPEKATAALEQGWKAPATIGVPPKVTIDPILSGTDEAPAIRIETTPPALERTVESDNKLAKANGLCVVPPQAGLARPTSPQADPSLLEGPARVPSCILVGKQLVNFALPDLDERPWEFRQRRGKLVLLDFWGTWCVPCRQAVTHLRILQDRYRDAGLEVIGITYERQANPAEQRRLVDGVCQRLRINYKVLMGGAECPVKIQFGVRALPTLVLLDQNGWIVWQHEGGLDAEDLKDLELRIQGRLGTR